MTTLLVEYDSQAYDPAAPVVPIVLQGRRRNAPRIAVTALIDTGADGTMLPLNLIRQLGAQHNSTASMRGVNNVSVMVDLYLVVVEIGSQRMPVEVAAMPPGSEIIIGRNVLNQLKITLDGLAMYTTIETPLAD